MDNQTRPVMNSILLSSLKMPTLVFKHLFASFRPPDSKCVILVIYRDPSFLSSEKLPIKLIEFP